MLSPFCFRTRNGSGLQQRITAMKITEQLSIQLDLGNHCLYCCGVIGFR